uniref:Targeting protein for Xklp2 n=1 Tax=Chenopodium quinoa TaxID=63459 RepID=A0A803N1N6_CHEQI
MEDSTSIVIDQTYEFSAPRFYDFINGESEEDTRNAELWFQSALSHAPSPFMLRIKASRSVQLSSLCDFGDVQTTTQASESHKPTTESSVSSEVFSSKLDQISSGQHMGMPGERNENSDPNLISSQQISIPAEVSCEKNCKEDSSTVTVVAPDVKIEPEIMVESATCPSQDVCTPKPPAFTSKGGRTTTEQKKKQTTMKIASALKNPSELKSKIQSHTRSTKPDGFRRDRRNLNSSVGTPNFVQENQAIKRQKLDDGKTRQMYVRDPPLPPVPFVSTAELMKKFQSSTRDSSLPQNYDGGGSVQGKSKLQLTRPKKPDFVSSQRVRLIKVKSSAELEEEMMTKMPKFKARLLNKKILEAPTLPPLPKSLPRKPKFQEFHLETLERANKNAEVSSVVSTESGHQIFESKGELGLFCNSKKQVTKPQEFHFAIDERIPPPSSSVVDLFDKLSLCSESSNHEKHLPRNTKPNPFHLYTEERGAEKERRLITELVQKQIEEEKARVPKATPYPYTTDFPVVPPKPGPKEFLSKDPIPLPEKERMPLTEVQEFNHHVQHRAVDRAEFDKKIKEKEMMYKRYREEAEAEKQMEEEKALKHLRRTLVPHARPLPKFANPFVPQKSFKDPTKPKSPKLHVLRRRERKESAGTDIKAAQSAAAALMR